MSDPVNTVIIEVTATDTISIETAPSQVITVETPTEVTVVTVDVTGPQGIQGVAGAVGAQGIQGVAGPQGAQGVPGATESITRGGGAVTVNVDGSITFAPAAGMPTTLTAGPLIIQDVYLHREAVNILAQRNGANVQTFRLYATYTDAANYERMFLDANASAVVFGYEKAGTGASKTFNVMNTSNAGVNFGTDNVARWQLTNTGVLYPLSDGNYDLGDITHRIKSLALANGTASVVAISFGAVNSGFYAIGSSNLVWSSGGMARAMWHSLGMQLSSTMLLHWATTIINGVSDVGLCRKAAGVLGVSNDNTNNVLGKLDCAEYRIAGNKVLGARSGAIADSDGTQADDTRAINALLAALRSTTGHGLFT